MNTTFQRERWNAAVVRPSREPEVENIVARIVANKRRYQAADKETWVPWYVIACLHNMESGGSFNHHMHEGSALTGRTKWAPKGRPRGGTPPFTWEESAIDAMFYDNMPRKNWGYLEDTLQAMELYNGAGYQKYHKDVPSPYLWAGTTIYSRGRYVSDGKWSQTSISKQIGCAAILKGLENVGQIKMGRLK